MNYKNLHDKIILRAKNRTLEGYGEWHHIKPRCMQGDNSKSNLVKLTAKEHYIVHKLLIKMHTGKNKKQMVYALYRMACRNNKQKMLNLTSFQYEKIRKLYSENHQMKNKETQLKVKKTQIEKYGNYAFITKQSLDKTKKTSLEKYGVEYAITKKQFMIDKYGVDNPRKLKVVCPYCNKNGQMPAMKRWHFDHCKNKSSIM